MMRIKIIKEFYFPNLLYINTITLKFQSFIFKIIFLIHLDKLLKNIMHPVYK